MNILSTHINTHADNASFYQEKAERFYSLSDKNDPSSKLNFVVMNIYRSMLRENRRKVKQLATIQHKLRKLSKLEDNHV